MLKKEKLFRKLPQVEIDRESGEEVVVVAMTREDAETLGEIIGESAGPLLMGLFVELRNTLRFSTSNTLSDAELAKFFRWDECGKVEDGFLPGLQQ